MGWQPQQLHKFNHRVRFLSVIWWTMLLCFCWALKTPMQEDLNWDSCSKLPSGKDSFKSISLQLSFPFNLERFFRQFAHRLCSGLTRVMWKYLCSLGMNGNISLSFLPYNKVLMILQLNGKQQYQSVSTWHHAENASALHPTNGFSSAQRAKDHCYLAATQESC